MTRRVNEGTTHWGGCWREHHACAVAMVEKLCDALEALERFHFPPKDNQARSSSPNHVAAVRLLAAHGRCTIESDDGATVTARWKK